MRPDEWISNSPFVPPRPRPRRHHPGWHLGRLPLGERRRFGHREGVRRIGGRRLERRWREHHRHQYRHRRGSARCRRQGCDDHSPVDSPWRDRAAGRGTAGAPRPAARRSPRCIAANATSCCSTSAATTVEQRRIGDGATRPRRARSSTRRIGAPAASMVRTSVVLGVDRRYGSRRLDRTLDADHRSRVEHRGQRRRRRHQLDRFVHRRPYGSNDAGDDGVVAASRRWVTNATVQHRTHSPPRRHGAGRSLSARRVVDSDARRDERCDRVEHLGQAPVATVELHRHHVAAAQDLADEARCTRRPDRARRSTRTPSAYAASIVAGKSSVCSA